MRIIFRIIRNGAFLAALMFLCACAATGNAPNGNADAGELTAPAEPMPAAVADPELAATLDGKVEEARRERHTYKIGPDDVLHFASWPRLDLAKDGVVRDDGTFFVPMAGNVPVAGLSLAEAQALVKDRLAPYVREPQVDLEIKEYRSQLFFANGEFRNPGSYPIKGSTTVLEAIGAAGGLTDNSNLAGAYLVRRGQVIPIDFLALFTRGRMSHNLPLADGDLLYVPSVSTSRVYVLGEVLRPAGVPVRTGRITLAQAIADAGGFNEVTAYKRGVKVIRGGLGSGDVIEVNFDDIVRGKRPDLLMLQPGDIVYVPASGLTKWDRVLGQILPNLSRIVVDAAAIDTMTK